MGLTEAAQCTKVLKRELAANGERFGKVPLLFDASCLTA